MKIIADGTDDHLSRLNSPKYLFLFNVHRRQRLSEKNNSAQSGSPEDNGRLRFAIQIGIPNDIPNLVARLRKQRRADFPQEFTERERERSGARTMRTLRTLRACSQRLTPSSRAAAETNSK